MTKAVLSGKDLEAMDREGFQKRRMKYKKNSRKGTDGVSDESETVQVIEVGVMEDFEIVQGGEEAIAEGQVGEVTCPKGSHDDFTLPLTEEDLMYFIA